MKFTVADPYAPDPLDRKTYWKDVYHHQPAAVTMEAEQVVTAGVGDRN